MDSSSSLVRIEPSNKLVSAFVSRAAAKLGMSLVDADGAPALPPRCAARYQLERRIGRGGYGTVWLARCRELDRPVALKVLHGRAAADPASVERFTHEAAVTARLVHPHIVRVWDHDLEDGVPWIAFEYLGETTLQALLKQQGRLPLAQALAAACQVAAALEVAHAQGVLHRDLKPENVIQAEPGAYKLIDFGVAGGNRNRRFRTDLNFIMGTPAYLAPEQIRCVPASPSTDQYQLGLMLHHLIAGTVPHFDDHLPRMLGRRSSEPVPPLSESVRGVTPGVDFAVRTMLSLEPGGRFPSMREARAALDAARWELPTGRKRRRQKTLRTSLDDRAGRKTPIAGLRLVVPDGTQPGPAAGTDAGAGEVVDAAVVENAVEALDRAADGSAEAAGVHVSLDLPVKPCDHAAPTADAPVVRVVPPTGERPRTASRAGSRSRAGGRVLSRADGGVASFAGETHVARHGRRAWMRRVRTFAVHLGVALPVAAGGAGIAWLMAWLLGVVG